MVISIVGGLLLLGLLVWFLDSPGGFGGANRIISSQWDNEYQVRSKDPKGLGFFDELLLARSGDTATIAWDYSALDTLKNAEKATMIYIGEALELKAYELKKLLVRVDSGATLFLSYTRSDRNSYDQFFRWSAYYWEYTNKAYVALGDTSLAFSPVFQNDTIYDDWFTFDPKAFRDTLSKPFLYSMYNPAAVQLRRGKGKIILHSMPQLFFNYQVLQPNGFAHASYCLNKIAKDQPVVWLEFARYVAPVGDDDEEGPEVERDSSYLQFIMQNEALRWAFLLAIAVFAVYVLFRAKRRQAVLPGIPEKRNMSLAFMDTLTSIYLSRNSPYYLLLLMRRNFYLTVSRHFYIELINPKTPEQQEQQEANIRRLKEKSKSDSEDLAFILDKLSKDALKSHTITTQTIADLHKAIRRFYHENGIMKEPAEFVKAGEEVVLHRSVLAGTVITLAFLVVLMRGLYLLAAANGIGIMLVIPAVAGLVFGGRFLSVPVARITRRSLTVYHPVFGKKTLEAASGEFAFTKKNDETIFYTPEGKQLSVKHSQLSRSGKHALRLFTEHLKQKAL